jgi:hypothetical protein
MQEMLRDREDCFSQIETALKRIERAVSRLKAEAALLRVERALNEAPLVPDIAPNGRVGSAQDDRVALGSLRSMLRQIRQ